MAARFDEFETLKELLLVVAHASLDFESRFSKELVRARGYRRKVAAMAHESLDTRYH